MQLPVMPPLSPMLAKVAKELPAEGDVTYEPKWDGFRCIVFRDGHEVVLGSRNTKPLDRYFPDLLVALAAELPRRCVVDGEIVIAGPHGLDFDALLARIHPAASRVRMLAQATPASYVAFDLVAVDNEDLRSHPFAERRQRLVQLLGAAHPPVYVTPATDDRALAQQWFERFEGAGLDGVVAKRHDLRYRPDKRAMVKVKHERTADCVVGGFRWRQEDRSVASLLLGLYDDAGVLHHVGVTSAFTTARRQQLVDELADLRRHGDEHHPWTSGTVPGARVPGGPSRWSAGRDLSWVPLRPELVCEVAYDHLQGDRFRHATTFRRWRPDRDARSCSYDQLQVAPAAELAEVFGIPRRA